MLNMYQSHVNTSVCLSNESFNSSFTPLATTSNNTAYNLGVGLGHIIGTCDEYGKPTENSYPLDKFVNYVYQKNMGLKNIFSIAYQKTTSFFNALTTQTSSLIFSETKVKNTNNQNNEFLAEIVKESVIPKLTNIRKDVLKFLTFSLENAKSQNKPLLLLVGEAHNVISASVMESYLLYLSSQIEDLNLKNVFTEAFDADFYRQSEYSAYPYNTVEKLATTLGLRKIQMDLAACKVFAPDMPEVCQSIDYSKLMSGMSIHSTEEAKLKGNVRKRNQVMSDVMTAFKQDGNALAVVGMAHLYGIMKETKLNEHFHVVPISVGPSSDERLEFETEQHCENEYHQTCNHYLKTSEEIKRLNYPLGVVDPLLHLFKSKDIMSMACEASHSNKEPDVAKSLCV